MFNNVFYSNVYATVLILVHDCTWPSLFLFIQCLSGCKKSWELHQMSFSFCNESWLLRMITTSGKLQGDSLTRGPKLLSIKYYVIEIMTWRVASLSCLIVQGVFLYTLFFNKPQRKRNTLCSTVHIFTHAAFDSQLLRCGNAEHRQIQVTGWVQYIMGVGVHAVMHCSRYTYINFQVIISNNIIFYRQ